MDLGLAPQLGLHRVHRQTVALHATVAAALADRLVDDDPGARLFESAALAAAPLLRGALLVVQQDGHALDGPQRRHRLVEAGARPDRGPRRQAHSGIPVEVLGRDDDLVDPLGEQGGDQLRHGGDADRRLRAGHRHVVVVEQLVGDVDPGVDGRPDRQRPGVRVGAVADVLDPVLQVGERRGPDPLRALTAHRGDADDLADVLGAHEDGQHVTAGAGADDGAGRHLGDRGVVRAAGAEVGRAAHRQGRQLARPGDPLQAAAELRQVGQVGTVGQPVGHEPGHRGGVQLGVDRHERSAVLVLLAEHERALRHTVELVLEVELDERALVLEHEDLFEPGGEFTNHLAVQRIRHPQVQQPHPEATQVVVVETQLAQRLTQLVVGLAGRHDAEPIALGAHRDPVEAVDPGVFERGRDARRQQRVLHGEHLVAVHVRIGPVQVGAAVEGHVDEHRLHPVGRHEGRPGAVGDTRGHLQRGPQPAGAGQRDGVQPEVEHLLHVTRVEHRHEHRRERELAATGGRRGLRGRVVTDERDRAPGAGRADEVGLADRVHRPVETIGLAVPEPNDPVVPRLGQLHGQLAAHHRGRTELLVDPHPVHDVVLGQQLAPPLQLQVVAAQRRARIAADEEAGVAPRSQVEPPLHERQPHQPLHPGEVDGALIDDELVLQTQRRDRRVGAGGAGGGHGGRHGTGFLSGSSCGRNPESVM